MVMRTLTHPCGVIPAEAGTQEVFDIKGFLKIEFSIFMSFFLEKSIESLIFSWVPASAGMTPWW